MICIKCRQPSTNVANSRPHKKHVSVWRRRHCEACGYTFTTTEAPVISESLQLIHRDGTSTPFSLPRLTVSFVGTLTHHHGKAPDEAYYLSETVYHLLMERGNGGEAIPMHEFVAAAHQVLERFDALAGLQYATRHKLVTNTRKGPGRPRLHTR